MNKLVDIYNSIQNPLDNKDTLLSLLDIYLDNEKRNVNRENRNQRFFNRSQHFYTSKSNKHISKYYPSIRDDLYSELFEIWKNNIINMTQEKYSEIYGDRGNFNDSDFKELVTYLNEIPTPTTYNEVVSIINNKVKNPLLNQAMSKYSFTTEDYSNFLSSWTHITSSKLAESNNSKNIKHSLFINVSSTCVDLFVSNLLSEFSNRKINYNFEFDKHAENDNSITIFLSDNELSVGIEILENVKKSIEQYQKNHPNHRDDFKIYNPPILAGKIDGWIGYGAIPDKDILDDDLSYLELRGKEIIPNAISNALREWCLENRDKQIKYGNLNLNYFSYFVKNIYDDFINTMYRSFEQHNYNSKFLRSRRNQRKFLYHITNAVDAIYSGEHVDEEVIIVELDDNESFSYTIDELEHILNTKALEIAKEDSNFLQLVQNQIKDECQKNGVEENEFCFNVNTLNTLKQRDAIDGHIQSKTDLTKKEEFKEKNRIKEIKQNTNLNGIKQENKINYQISNIEITKKLASKYLKNAQGQKVTTNTVKSLFNFINSEIDSFMEKINNNDFADETIYTGILEDGFTFTITKNDINSIINDIINEKENQISKDDSSIR